MESYDLINKPKEYKSWDSISKYSKFVAEPKYDGVRMLAEKKDGILSIHREDKNVKNIQFPEVLLQLANMPDNTIFDGELCILDESHNELPSLRAEFSKIQKRILVKNPTKISLLSDKTPATFMAFDCIKFEGKDVRGQTLTERRNYLHDEIHTCQYNPEELLALIQKHDMEGIVVKDPNSQYNQEWFKFKNYVETDYKVIGINSLEHNISSLELENFKGENMGSVNWQFYQPEYQTPEVAKALVGMTVSVRHMITSKGKPRFPILTKKDQILKVLKENPKKQGLELFV